MARQNVQFVTFNRGLLSPKALARVDLERTQVSAEVMTNWLPKTQGAMTIRPGTKYLGSSLNDSGAEFIEFVASTEETALLEITPGNMRVWIDDVVLNRPHVDTSIQLVVNVTASSTGGTRGIDKQDYLPLMTATKFSTPFQTFEITASSFNVDATYGGLPWQVGDDDHVTEWHDTGLGHTTLPSWLNVDFDTGGAGDTGTRRSVHHYAIRNSSAGTSSAPRAWRLLGSNFDTGTFAIDTGKWTMEDERTAQTDWELQERRKFTLTGGADTGTIPAYRHWRLYVTQTDTGAGGTSPEFRLRIAEFELFPGKSAAQVDAAGSQGVFNAISIGALARASGEIPVAVADRSVEHSLVIDIARGPITIRVGSASGADDYIANTSLGTGWHNLAFTPTGNFHVTLQTNEPLDRIVRSIAVGDSGPVIIPAPWDTGDLNKLRYDQSADVVYVDCDGRSPRKIERRGDGRSWSVVEYEPVNGPFLPLPSSEAKLSVSHKYGNTKMSSDIPFFTPGHKGGLMRLTTNGQSGQWLLGAAEATTDAIEVVGIGDTGDTGSPSQNSERRLDVSVAGTYAGTITIERSFDGPDFGFHSVSQSGNYIKPVDGGAGPSDTGTFSRVINDPDDNVTAWYRARLSAYTSGTAVVTMTYDGLSVDGIGRITTFNNSQEVEIEVLSRFSDTGPTDLWQEGEWSGTLGYPTAVAFHSGRLAHAKGAALSMSVSDDYENFDDTTEGDAAPIQRTLGSGPVDNIHYLLSLLRLIIGTSGSEISLRSSSLDEPVTPTNSSVYAFSTQGSANVRPAKLDTKGIFVQRSGQRVYLIGFSPDVVESDYALQELTKLVPDLLEAGVTALAVQRQPDTRLHCVLGDGRVGILTIDIPEEVLCWSVWETDGVVERVAVLPGTGEDKVYYHVRRTINSSTKRYLERWATETECRGDTGLTFIMDSAVVLTNTDSGVQKAGALHLRGEQVVVVAQDTGQATAMRDLSPDVAGVQDTYLVGDSGLIILDTGNFTNIVAGLPYTATWKSTKLAYAAQAGTALAQLKRTDKIGLLLHRTHNNALFFGNDTGNLDPLPRKLNAGAVVDADQIFEEYDLVAMPFPGLWHADSRIVLRGKAPRPVTVLGAVPTVATNEEV